MYPDGDTPINELLQNADDARATTVRFVLDAGNVSFGHESLHPIVQEVVASEAEAGGVGATTAWQGPALYCYNDGPGFTETDFAAIRRIRAESKTNQNAATGKFGLGFQSVYHITDAPSVVSNSCAAFFDPNRRYWPKGGAELKLAVGDDAPDGPSDAVAPTDFPDQFEPLRLFGGADGASWDMHSPFNGALIRLPLRQQDGELGDVYSHEKAHDQLQRLRTLGSSLLLFLKSVRTIEVFARSEASVEPKLQFSVRRQYIDKPPQSSIEARVRAAPSRPQLYDGLLDQPEFEINHVQVDVLVSNGAGLFS